MKIKQPEPFMFEAGPRAVLLLHGFTGHTADVRMLGRFLTKKGYTTYAPIYRGHGGAAEEIVKATAEDWWTDVKEAYHHLRERGFEEIAVAGLSLGGVLGLKLSYYEKVKAIIPMCAPMFFDNEEQLTSGFFSYAKQYKQFERKTDDIIERELDALKQDAHDILLELGDFVVDVSKEVDSIYAPAFVVQSTNDKVVNPESAKYIYEHIQAENKQIKWYEKSGHVITLDDEKEQLHEDIYGFLESLNWQQ